MVVSWALNIDRLQLLHEAALIMAMNFMILFSWTWPSSEWNGPKVYGQIRKFTTLLTFFRINILCLIQQIVVVRIFVYAAWRWALSRDIILVHDRLFFHLIHYWLGVLVICGGACSRRSPYRFCLWELEFSEVVDSIVLWRLLGEWVILLKLLSRRLDCDGNIEVLLLPVAICFFADSIMA